jgi:lipopolysaccharide/colanic/teichoic acid biosynthesis glycosyltransferase
MKNFIATSWGELLDNQPQHPRVAFVVTASCSLGFLCGQLEYLRSHGFDISVISSGGPEQEAARHEGASVFTVPMQREISLAKDVLSLWRLWRTLRRIRPDVTIVGTPKAGLLGGLAAVLAGVPKRIYVLHGLRLETSVGWLRKVLVGCEWMACRCAQSVRCVSPSLMKRVMELGIVTADKCNVAGKGTSNGIDAERWRCTPEAAAVARQTRKRLGIPLQAPVVGFVGRFTRDKGIVELYEAFTRVQPAYPDLRLLLVGDFEVGDPVPAMGRDRIEADPAVVRIGFVADVAPYLWTMDMLVLPTYREGFPGSPLEAQAASIPVVTTDATGAIDAILDGVTGIRVPVGDVGALTAALDRLLADPEERARMGQAGCSWVQQNFQRETVWESLLASYRSILQPVARRRQSGFGRIAKVGFDRPAAALALILSAPLWLAAAIAIRCSLGYPVLFRRMRPGLGGRPFPLFKFRTMRDTRGPNGERLDDRQRLTTLGRLLRALSIDELPQLWNVLRGEMSLVGPRPLLMEYLDRYTPEQARRHEVMPGITGWAQVNGRNALNWEEKFRLDVWYVDHASILLDLRILCLTLLRVIQPSGISSQGHATMPEFMGKCK